MRLRTSLVVLVAAATAVLPSAAAMAAGGAPSSTDLVGVEEVPGPGDPDASGFAALTLNSGLGTVCYDLSWADIDGDVVAAHIHVGSAGVAGPVVVPLPTAGAGGSGSSSGCVENVDRDLVKAIRKNASDYYVNVHSTTFPAGAIRGQLGD